MGVWYATREDVKAALDFKESARSNTQIDRLIDAASRAVEALCHRRFYPQVATRYFDWPTAQTGRYWRLWLDGDELVSITTLSSGGTTIAAAGYFLEPANSGPPYTRLELDLAGGAAFGGGSTHQRDITITGVFGYSAGDEPAGALAEALDGSETGVDVTNSALIDVGHVIKVGSERMLVTGRSMLSTSQTLQAPLTASAADVTVAVTTGSSYAVGETLLLDSERMLVVDAAGNSLTVKRAWDGTVLAAHTGSAIFAPRSLTVTRGALGTTAATHADTTAVTRHAVPPLVRQLVIAETVNALQQEGSAYARVVGSGEGQREAAGRGLADLRDQVRTRYGRKARTRVV